MSTVYLAIFDPDEFEAVKGLLGPDMTDTNEEWRDLTFNRVRQLRLDGDEAVAVKIHPDELRVILTTHRHHGGLDALDILAALKGGAGQRD